MKHDPFGCYRSLDPPGVLPQNCWKLDSDPHPKPGEKAVAVEVLKVDSASFRQLREESDRRNRSLEETILDLVAERGKLHNPVTGSGGILLGSLADGRRIATLISLSLTPLHLERIEWIDTEKARIHVRGTAILFEKTLFCDLPGDLPEGAALAALDVAGAPARCGPLSRSAERVLILGAGKAGLLVAAAIRQENPRAQILVADLKAGAVRPFRDLGLCDRGLTVDATSPLATYNAVDEATQGALCDLAINVVNVPNSEGATILSTRDGGIIYFFGMATDFARAALTAEGVARQVEMIIGTGYVEGWTDYALGLLREDPALLGHFKQAYG